jgi:hypothetical protein
MGWIDIDEKGLAKQVEGRSKAFILFELISNAWDAPGTTCVDVAVEPVAGLPKSVVSVVDDSPSGFSKLSDAYMLFGDSERKGNPEARGRFMAGEKLVLALCQNASIWTTSGAVHFEEKNGKRTRRFDKTKLAAGSRFQAVIRLTQSDREEVYTEVMRLIPPTGVTTTFNGQTIQPRTPVVSFKAALSTPSPDADGVMRMVRRVCTVDVHEAKTGEKPTLYEMGIPVVELPEGSYHVNVQQKLPLGIERDNVPPSFMRKINTALVNALVEAGIGVESISDEAWVTDAIGSPDAAPDAVRAVIKARFGEKAVAFDPSDREANNRLVAQGYTVVHGRSLPASAWTQVRDSGALLPAGKVSPTPKVYSDDPNAPPEELIPPAEWTEGMTWVFHLACDLCEHVLGVEPTVRFVREGSHAAWWGRHATEPSLTFNVGALGKAWFDGGLVPILDLLIHEMAHQEEANHLDARYHKACTKIGAYVAVFLMRNPRNDPEKDKGR